MRTFDVPYMDKIDWERVPELRIDQHLWSDVRSIVPSAQICWNGDGMTLRANFYKCGDDTAQPHYIAWNAVDHPTPNFHLPQYFGELHLT